MLPQRLIVIITIISVFLRIYIISYSNYSSTVFAIAMKTGPIDTYIEFSSFFVPF